MVIGAREGAEIECCTSEDAIVEVTFETRIFRIEWAKVIDVVGEEIRCPSRKAGYA